jgi:putative ABC transport system ATP-binding protein
VDAPLIGLRDVAFGYGGDDVLRGVTAEVRRGDFIVVRGPSGGGKSTLLRLLARLEVPRSGALFCDGAPYDDIPATVLRRRIAYLQQLPVILPGSVRENLLLSCRFAQPPTPTPGDVELRAQLERARLGSVDLEAPAEALSVGQKQRLAFIRLLLMRPEAMLLDEPVASLDLESAAILHAWMAELHARSDVTLLLVSHAQTDDLPPGARRWLVDRGTVTEEVADRSAAVVPETDRPVADTPREDMA